jgi:TRAP-type C4-dicarboxylate transport system permease small subunit
VAFANLAVLAFTLGQVADRYMLKGAFNANDQIARIGLVWMTFCGMAMAFRERVNIVVDLIDKYITPPIAAAKAIALDILSIGVVVLLVAYGMRLMEVGSYQRVMGTPFTYSVVYSSLLAGCALLLLFLVVRVATALVEFLSGRGAAS